MRRQVLTSPNFEIYLEIGWAKFWRRFWRGDALDAL
jgi:hypothetical protein